MEYRLRGSGRCDWCGAVTSMPAALCVMADPDVLDCLCDGCAEAVERIKRERIAERLVSELEWGDG